VVRGNETSRIENCPESVFCRGTQVLPFLRHLGEYQVPPPVFTRHRDPASRFLRFRHASRPAAIPGVGDLHFVKSLGWARDPFDKLSISARASDCAQGSDSPSLVFG